MKNGSVLVSWTSDHLRRRRARKTERLTMTSSGLGYSFSRKSYHTSSYSSSSHHRSSYSSSSHHSSNSIQLRLSNLALTRAAAAMWPPLPPCAKPPWTSCRPTCTTSTASPRPRCTSSRTRRTGRRSGGRTQSCTSTTSSDATSPP